MSHSITECSDPEWCSDPECPECVGPATPERGIDDTPSLVGRHPRWWQFFSRWMIWRWTRRHGLCLHPYPTYGDERLYYGLRCGVCFQEVEWEDR